MTRETKPADKHGNAERVELVDAQGDRHALPIVRPTRGPDTVDVRGLYAGARMFTYDPGFGTTARRSSAASARASFIF